MRSMMLLDRIAVRSRKIRLFIVPSLSHPFRNYTLCRQRHVKTFVPLSLSAARDRAAQPSLPSPLSFLFFQSSSSTSPSCSSSHSGNIIRACLSTEWMERAVQSPKQYLHGERDERGPKKAEESGLNGEYSCDRPMYSKELTMRVK